MKLKTISSVLVIAATFLVSGCETTSKDEKALMMGQIADIDKRVKFLHGNVKVQADMAANMEQLQSSLLTLTEQIKELNERSQTLTERMGKAERSTGQRVVLERTKATNIRLESISEKLNKLSAETLAFIGLMEARNKISRRDHRAAVASAGGSDDSNASAQEGQADNDKIPSAFSDLAPEDLYQQSYEAYLKGTYDDAVTGFGEYVRRYPNTELSDNAAYWIGEAHYGKADYGRALEAFDTMVANYPDSNKAPAGLLKSAYAMSKLGSEKSALERLNKIIEFYPTSNEAIIATERIDSMQGEGNN